MYTIYIHKNVLIKCVAAHSDFANITYNKSNVKLKLNKEGGGVLDIDNASESWN